MNPKIKQSRLSYLADEIETEMKMLGLWNESLKTTNEVRSAFGAESLTFEEWLQSVFLPNLRQAANSNTFPNRSSMALAAIRNLDGLSGTENLIRLLTEVDSLIQGSTR